jgi:hypothetical protein
MNLAKSNNWLTLMGEEQGLAELARREQGLAELGGGGGVIE